MSPFLTVIPLRLRGALLLCAVIAAGAVLAGCVAGPAVAKADAPRDAAPNAPADDVDALVTGDTAFALDLYHRLATQDGNIVASPYSISVALAMVYGGARSTTADQMARTLHFSLPQDRLHPAVNALDQTISGRARNSDDANKPDFQLNIANGVWGQQGYGFAPDYLTLLARNYGSGIQLVDFAKSPGPSRQAINGWVSDQTKGKIKDLFPPDAITPDTRLALANAIYFNGKWANPFESSATTEGDFTLLDGGTVKTQMMSSRLFYAMYGAGDGYQAASLSYQSAQGGPAMLIILPDRETFGEFEDGLDVGRFSAIRAGLKPGSVDLSMPRFKVETSFSLADQLKALGMPDAFDPALADFTGMVKSPQDNLFISAVMHKAFINVTEEGTEAAAATGVSMMPASAALDEPPRMQVDHPFLFAIYDQGTGEILFLGRVLNPA